MLSFLKIKIVKILTNENKIEHFGLVVEFKMGMLSFVNMWGWFKKFKKKNVIFKKNYKK